MTAVVVSDTSPIRALKHLGLLDLLPSFYDQVLLPPAVASELAATTSGMPALHASEMPWLVVRAPRDRDQVAALALSLGAGESEAIALAIEVNADALLIDERKGRTQANRVGVKIMGTIGLLLRAKSMGHIDRLSPLLDSLETGIAFRIAVSLRNDALRLAGESPQ
jgi:predicted nucleic acid-binding protein